MPFSPISTSFFPLKKIQTNQSPLNKKNNKKLVYTYMAYFRRMRPKTGLCREPFSTNGTMKRPIFGPFDLSVMISEMLLKVRELNKSPSAVRQMALVGPLSCKKETINDKPSNLKEIHIRYLSSVVLHPLFRAISDFNHSSLILQGVNYAT